MTQSQPDHLNDAFGPHGPGHHCVLPRVAESGQGHVSGRGRGLGTGRLEDLGLRRPLGGGPPSRFARVMSPGRDSTRADLKLILRISPTLIALFAVGGIAQNWVRRICDISDPVVFDKCRSGVSASAARPTRFGLA
jgi:hypothetical protein